MFEETGEAAGARDADAWVRGLDEQDFEVLRQTAALNGIDLYRRGFLSIKTRFRGSRPASFPRGVPSISSALAAGSGSRRSWV